MIYYRSSAIFADVGCVTVKVTSTQPASASQVGYLLTSLAVKDSGPCTEYARMDFHPIANIFPLLGEDALAALRDDIASNGLQYPVITFEGKILDGRNRYTACKLAGVDPQFEEFEGTKADALKAVWSWNVTRRHLASDQVAVALGLRLKLDAEFAAEVQAIRQEAESKKKTGKKDLTQNFAEGRDERTTDHRLAEAAGTNRTYLAQARKLIDASPELAQDVLDGKKKLHAAIKEAIPQERKDPPPFDADMEASKLADRVSELVERWPAKHRRTAAFMIITTLEQKYVT